MNMLNDSWETLGASFKTSSLALCDSGTFKNNWDCMYSNYGSDISPLLALDWHPYGIVHYCKVVTLAHYCKKSDGIGHFSLVGVSSDVLDQWFMQIPLLFRTQWNENVENTQEDIYWFTEGLRTNQEVGVGIIFSQNRWIRKYYYLE